MSLLEEELLTWKECTDMVKMEIRKIERALTSNEAIAVADTYPIRALETNMDGFAPLLNPPTRNQPTDRIEVITGVPPQFRLAVTLEHSLSLIVSDLIRRYYKDGDLVRRLNEQAVDIKTTQSILVMLKTWICSYQEQFVQYGHKYAAVRRKCHEFYLLWHDERNQIPPPLKEVDLETYVIEMGVVRDLALQLTQIRRMIQTGNMSPGV
ncbi:hypothetical protein TGAMA5MH_08200 [Trichoderma gamsii]|uniref:Uncharacterized protein n=1 Tax=Trichoderma gamsii TaxID=398673 RepID=A0A2K0T336_9HYPO|nr:hypothetical protein TGAMA5MH_08200 [Trichoderma gamsii]